jgi:hypothetical protein
MAVGPRVLGHEPLVLGDQREQLVKTVEDNGLGLVSFRRRNDPALPALPDL